VPEAVSDTGPILHLQEIGRLAALTAVSPLRAPDLVWTELQDRGIDDSALRRSGIDFSVIPLPETIWQPIPGLNLADPIQPADAQVFCLVEASRFEALALTDDLALRKLLESYGALVVGSVGLLVRAYSEGRLQRVELDRSIEALFNDSTLHLSRAFRAYLMQLLKNL
jgi:predicted nucleic acid-binding protein